MTSTFFLTLHKTIGLLPRSKVPDDDRHKQAHKQRQNSSVGCSVKKIKRVPRGARRRLLLKSLNKKEQSMHTLLKNKLAHTLAHTNWEGSTFNNIKHKNTNYKLH